MELSSGVLFACCAVDVCVEVITLCVFAFVACCVGAERREGRGVDRSHPFLS